MFKNTFQSGFLSILYSIGSKPLQIWDNEGLFLSLCDLHGREISVKNGHIKRITDEDIQSSVLEIMSTNVSTTFITCPLGPSQTLGIKLPFLVMIIKNLKKYFSFEVQVLDDKGVRRRFRASNYQVRLSKISSMNWMAVHDESEAIHLYHADEIGRRMESNPIQSLRFHTPCLRCVFCNCVISDAVLGTNYIETLRVTIHANCRIRRIYFSDRLYSEEELPPEFKLFLPIQKS